MCLIFQYIDLVRVPVAGMTFRSSEVILKVTENDTV